MQPLNRHWSREVDRRAINDWHMLGLVLMENAGRGAADWIAANTKPDDQIAILCGKGNNAGDGFVIARHLDAMARRVSMVLLADPNSLQGDALANWRIVERSRIPRVVVDSSDSRPAIEYALRGATVIVDAMLGTGATGDPRSPMSDAIKIANAFPAMRIAIDLPTGLDCDTGVASATTFRADHTLTFVASKIGFDVAGARAFTGQVHVFSIGVPGELLEEIEKDAKQMAQPTINSSPNVCGGAACIGRTRIPIWTLERMRRLGLQETEILQSFPTLSADDLVHAWTYVREHKAEIENDIRSNEEESEQSSA